MEGCIYKIENTVNGKVYIGQTIQKPNVRFQAHVAELNSGRKKNEKLQAAWNKYGPDAFTFSVLFKCDEKDLDRCEIETISQYDSFKNGYNATTGGKQVMENRRHSEETKRKISKISKRLWDTESYRVRLEYVHKTHRNIICVNTGAVFEDSKAAAKWANVESSNILRSCKAKNTACGKDANNNPLFWAWADEYSGYSVNEIKRHIGGNNRKTVINIDTGAVFASAAEAAQILGLNATVISKACNGNLKTAYGCRWAFKG